MSDVPPVTQSRRNGGLTFPMPTWRCCGSPPNIGETIEPEEGGATICFGSNSVVVPLTLPPKRWVDS